MKGVGTTLLLHSIPSNIDLANINGLTADSALHHVKVHGSEMPCPPPQGLMSAALLRSVDATCMLWFLPL